MLIIRRDLSFDRGFTRIPNDWVRDKRLSLKAKGLLAQLLSHADGWTVSVQSLAKQNECGRDAIRAAVGELEEAGYLTRRQDRAADGSWASWIWETTSPASGFPAPGNPASGNPTPKKTKGKKTIEKKNGDLDERFDEFWSIYPRKVGKAQALRVFARNLDRADEVIEGARRMAADPNLPEPRFIPYPSTWLNREGWSDEPYPVSSELPSKPIAQGPGKREWVKSLHDVGEHFACDPSECDSVG